MRREPGWGRLGALQGGTEVSACLPVNVGLAAAAWRAPFEQGDGVSAGLTAPPRCENGKEGTGLESREQTLSVGGGFHLKKEFVLHCEVYMYTYIQVENVEAH